MFRSVLILTSVQIILLVVSVVAPFRVGRRLRYLIRRRLTS